MLENESVSLHGYTFVGATLWTKIDVMAGLAIQQTLGDYKETGILYGDRRVSPDDLNSLNRQSLRYIEDALHQATDPSHVVIVTHHSPSLQSWKERGGPLSKSLVQAFANDLDELIKAFEPAVMIHGRMHDSNSYTIGSTQVVSNPRGYVRENGQSQNKDFDTNGIVLDIPVIRERSQDIVHNTTSEETETTPKMEYVLVEDILDKHLTIHQAPEPDQDIYRSKILERSTSIKELMHKSLLILESKNAIEDTNTNKNKYIKTNTVYFSKEYVEQGPEIDVTPLPRFNNMNEVQMKLQKRELQKKDTETLRLEPIQMRMVDLSGLDFSNTDLQSIDFRGSDISNCNFSNSVLWQANFSRTTMNGTNFENANLEGAEFDFVLGNNINFKGANMSHSSAERSDFSNSNFDNAKLLHSEIYNSKLDNCSFDKTEVSYARVYECSLENVNTSKLRSDDRDFEVRTKNGELFVATGKIRNECDLDSVNEIDNPYKRFYKLEEAISRAEDISKKNNNQKINIITDEHGNYIAPIDHHKVSEEARKEMAQEKYKELSLTELAFKAIDTRFGVKMVMAMGEGSYCPENLGKAIERIDLIGYKDEKVAEKCLKGFKKDGKFESDEDLKAALIEKIRKESELLEINKKEIFNFARQQLIQDVTKSIQEEKIEYGWSVNDVKYITDNIKPVDMLTYQLNANDKELREVLRKSALGVQKTYTADEQLNETLPVHVGTVIGIQTGRNTFVRALETWEEHKLIDVTNTNLKPGQTACVVGHPTRHDYITEKLSAYEIDKLVFPEAAVAMNRQWNFNEEDKERSYIDVLKPYAETYECEMLLQGMDLETVIIEHRNPNNFENSFPDTFIIQDRDDEPPALREGQHLRERHATTALELWEHTEGNPHGYIQDIQNLKEQAASKAKDTERENRSRSSGR